MAEQAAIDLALLVLRVGIGIVFVAHGYNHFFGGGRLSGTARWFESLGMRPGRLHAWVASLAELGGWDPAHCRFPDPRWLPPPWWARCRLPGDQSPEERILHLPARRRV